MTTNTGIHISVVPWVHLPSWSGGGGTSGPRNHYVPINPVGDPWFAPPPPVVVAAPSAPMTVPINSLPSRPRTQIVANASDTLLPTGYVPYVQLPSADTQAAANTGADLLALRAGSPPDRADETISLVSEGLIAPPAHAKAKKMKGICLVNPVETGGTVGYLLNDTECRLKPGEVHQLPTDEYTLKFDRGDNHGEASYNLSERTYVFYNDPKKGWEIYSKAFKVTLDNSRNPNPFAGVLDGKEVQVGARQSQTFKSPYPMLLAFDPGDGSEPSRRWLIGGSYKVGIGAQTALLDLFSHTQASAGTKTKPGAGAGEVSVD